MLSEREQKSEAAVMKLIAALPLSSVGKVGLLTSIFFSYYYFESLHPWNV